jgi:hypothetical protein
MPQPKLYESAAERQKAYRARKKESVHFRSRSDMWVTPQDLFDELNVEFGFDLDVSALPENAKCPRFFTPQGRRLEAGVDGHVLDEPALWPHCRQVDREGKAQRRGERRDGGVCCPPAPTPWWHEQIAPFLGSASRPGSSKAGSSSATRTTRLRSPPVIVISTAIRSRRTARLRQQQANQHNITDDTPRVSQHTGKNLSRDPAPPPRCMKKNNTAGQQQREGGPVFTLSPMFRAGESAAPASGVLHGHIATRTQACLLPGGQRPARHLRGRGRHRPPADPAHDGGRLHRDPDPREERADGQAGVGGDPADVRLSGDRARSGGQPGSRGAGAALQRAKGKTPVLAREDAKRLLASIPTLYIYKEGKAEKAVPHLVGLRDRALIALMIFSFARVGAVTKLTVGDYQQNGKKFSVALKERAASSTSCPCTTWPRSTWTPTSRRRALMER